MDENRPDPQGPYERLIAFVADRPGHDLRYAIDADRVSRELSWQPQESFETGIIKTVAWYLENGSWLDAVRGQRYQGQRLGLQPE